MPERQTLAELFLAEAVYASRSVQARASGLEGLAPRSDGGGGDAPGQCGLGAEAALSFEPTPRARELFEALWPEGLADGPARGVRGLVQAWVERQDALDRRRNHFMKDFRRRHGFDRNAYAPDVLAAWEAGLGQLNGSVEEQRRAAAAELLTGLEPA